MRSWLGAAFLLVCCSGNDAADKPKVALPGAGGNQPSGGSAGLAATGAGGGNGASGGTTARGGSGGSGRAGSGGSVSGSGNAAGAGDGDAGEASGATGGSSGTGGTNGGTGSTGGTGGGGTGGSGNSGGLPAVGKGAITGFGVNGQPRNWGTDGTNVKAALDLLIDDLGSNFFRVEIDKGSSDWEATNDDDDPTHFEWAEYDEIFADKDFRDLWDYVRYLNSKGVTEIELAAHGLVPLWMGGSAVSASMNEEYVETLLAVLLYARNRAPEPRPVFSTFAPWNETDLGTTEGVRMGSAEGVPILRRLVQRMGEFPELDDIRIVAPEASHWQVAREWEGPMLDDELIAARLGAVAFHRYGGYTESDDWSSSPRPWWLTEFNDSGSFCYTATWANGMNLAANLLSGLQRGVQAALVWADYDAAHIHSADRFETFGLLATSYDGRSELCNAFSQAPSTAQLDEMTYAPKPTFHAAKHVFRHVARGAERRPIAAIPGVEVVAYENPDGSTVVFGVNGGDAGEFQLDLGDGAPSSMVSYVSSDGSYHQRGDDLTLSGGRARFSLPARSVFTLVGEN